MQKRNRFSFANITFASVLMGFLLVTSCLKANDPPPTDMDPSLTNHYCNDPRAINYNWGFPGIPDNSKCIFPIDLFTGNWLFTDSVFFTDDFFDTTIIRNIVFKSTEDTLFTGLSVAGLCQNNNFSVLLTTDKFGAALIDSMDSHNAGQFFCNATDTITGSFKLQFNSRDSMDVEYSIKGANARRHKGIAVKQ